MRPVLFDYATRQREGDLFSDIVYDYDSDLNTIEGKPIVDRFDVNTAYLTKTKTHREADDNPNTEFLSMLTKTEQKLESDDDMGDANQEVGAASSSASSSSLKHYLALLTKTDQHRPEQDD